MFTTEEQLENLNYKMDRLYPPKKHITTAPTHTPRNFYEQIEVYDDGVNFRIYVYVNGTWRYAALT